jgi:predicted NAD/FAD-binding protein
VKVLTKGWTDQILPNQTVRKVVRNREPSTGEVQSVSLFTTENSLDFDQVIFACHSDQALRILGSDVTETEQEILSAFPYQKNVALLHSQSDVLPKQRRAWASWNYFNPKEESTAATVTYNMNILQSLDSETTWCVTLNGEDLVRDENVVASIEYAHPTFSAGRRVMQARHLELCNLNATSFCGAYWGNGFHEDGVASALRVVDAIENESAPVAT